MVRETNKLLSFIKFLPILFTFILVTACGDGNFIGYGDSNFSGEESGGEIFYSYDDEGEDEFSDSGSEAAYDSGAFGRGANGFSGDSYYNTPTEGDSIDIPVNIAKCEDLSGHQDTDDRETISNSTYHLMMRSLSKSGGSNFKTLRGVSKPLALRGAPGTYRNLPEDTSVYVLNVSTGESVITDVNSDGSFDEVELDTSGNNNVLWVAAYDGDQFHNPYVFVPRNSVNEDEDEAEICLIPDEEEQNRVLRTHMDLNIF